MAAEPPAGEAAVPPAGEAAVPADGEAAVPADGEAAVPAGGEAAVPPAAMPPERVRASRRLLSEAAALPKELTDRFPLMDGVTFSHTQHRDSSRPLFQARLASGLFRGKLLGCSIMSRMCVCFDSVTRMDAEQHFRSD